MNKMQIEELRAKLEKNDDLTRDMKSIDEISFWLKCTTCVNTLKLTVNGNERYVPVSNRIFSRLTALFESEAKMIQEEIDEIWQDT
jgi:hypothetical protein